MCVFVHKRRTIQKENGLLDDLALSHIAVCTSTPPSSSGTVSQENLYGRSSLNGKAVCALLFFPACGGVCELVRVCVCCIWCAKAVNINENSGMSRLQR